MKGESLLPRSITIACTVVVALTLPHLYSQHLLRSRETYDVYQALMTTTATTYLSFALSATVSIAVCGLAYANLGPRGLRRFDRLVSGLRSIPSIAWLPILVIIPPLVVGGIRFLGGVSGRPAAILFATLSTFPLISAHVIHSFSACSESLLYLGTRSGSSKLRMLLNIVVPSSLSNILQGFRYGASLCFILVIVHEQIVGGDGLGTVVQFTEVIHSPVTDAIITTVIVAAIGILIDETVQYANQVSNAFLRRVRIKNAK